MIRQKKQDHKIKIWILFIVGLVFFVNQTFEANSCDPESIAGITYIKNALMRIWDIASWMWILLGNLAGKLMTNTLIYGEFMNFDTFLWKIWQISRTFANYTIWFIFLYHILKYLLIPSAKTKSPTGIIKDLLITSVLIQASWFLVMATIDISTISLATISSLPSQVISDSQHLQNEFITEMKKNQIIGNALNKKAPKATYINSFSDRFDTLRKVHGWESIDIDQNSLQNISEETLVDAILPKPDNLAGPLTYMWFTVFKTHNFLRDYNIKDANCIEALTKTIISLILDAWMIILYAFSLAILVIILIVRALYLWIFIALSPIIILLGTKLLDIGKVSSFLDRKKILKLIFQPVLFGLWISIMFLFVVVVQGFFHAQNEKVNFDNGSITIKESSQLTEWKTNYSSELSIGENAKFFVTQGAKSLWDILLGILALAMMRYFIKLAITAKTGISGLDSFTKNLSWLIEKAAWNIGVIPTPVGQIGFKQVWDPNTESSPILNSWKNTQESKLQKTNADQIESVQNFLGVNNQWTKSLRSDQSNNLSKAVQTSIARKEFVDTITSIKQENRGIKFTELKPHIINWIDNGKDKESELKTYLWTNYTWSKITGKDNTETEKNLETVFNTPGVAQNFYTKVLWWEGEVHSYSDLNSIRGEVK